MGGKRILFKKKLILPKSYNKVLNGDNILKFNTSLYPRWGIAVTRSRYVAAKLRRFNKFFVYSKGRSILVKPQSIAVALWIVDDYSRWLRYYGWWQRVQHRLYCLNYRYTPWVRALERQQRNRSIYCKRFFSSNSVQRWARVQYKWRFYQKWLCLKRFRKRPIMLKKWGKFVPLWLYKQKYLYRLWCPPWILLRRRRKWALQAAYPKFRYSPALAQWNICRPNNSKRQFLTAVRCYLITAKRRRKPNFAPKGFWFRWILGQQWLIYRRGAFLSRNPVMYSIPMFIFQHLIYYLVRRGKRLHTVKNFQEMLKVIKLRHNVTPSTRVVQMLLDSAPFVRFKGVRQGRRRVVMVPVSSSLQQGLRLTCNEWARSASLRSEFSLPLRLAAELANFFSNNGNLYRWKVDLHLAAFKNRRLITRLRRFKWRN